MKTNAMLLLLAFAAAGAAAQDSTTSTSQCQLSDTPVQCYNRYVPAIPDVPATVETMVQSNVTTANTGLSSLVSPSGSALKDFLSVLSGSLDIGTLSQNGQTMTFDWNPKIRDAGALKLEVVFADPTVSGSVSTALASNPAAVTALNDSLSNTDDITASASYTPLTTSYGRSIAPHRGFFEALMATAPDTAKLDDEMINALRTANVTTASFGQTFAQLGAAGSSTMQAVEAAGRANQAKLVVASSLARAFAFLLNNQPQFYGSAVYHERTPVAGPDEWYAKATYEYGFRNLNSFFRTYRSVCDPLTVTATTAPQCLQMLEKYAGTYTPDTVVDPGRLTLSLEYHQASASSVSLPQYSLQLDTKSGHSIVGSAAYGRVIVARPDRRSGRIDVTLSYEDISNAAAIPSITNPSADVKDRWVGAITYTQKMSDTVSFPISLVYANHASYLPNVDRKLTSHFGLQYKLPQ